MAAHVYEKNDRHMGDIEIIKRTWPYIKPYAGKIAFVLFLMILMIAFDLAASVLPGYVTSSLGTIVDKFKDSGNITIGDMKGVFTVCIVSITVNVVNTLFIYVVTMSLQKIGQSIIYDLRMIVFEHIENMSIAQLNEIPVGSLVTRVASDTNALSDLFTNTIVNMIKNLLMLIGVICVMYMIDWRIASILMSFLPIIAVSSLIFRKMSRSNYRKVRHSFSVMNAFLNENISGMKITQIFNQEEQKNIEFERADVLHLHWVNQGYLSINNLNKILHSGKRVVITMHDQWYFTGICHYSGDCDKYTSHCHHCTLMNGTAFGDFASQLFDKKQHIYEDS